MSDLVPIAPVITFVCYGLTALIALGFGLIYLTRSQFMPYHRDALQRDWHELDPQIQTLILALMRVAGGGWLAAGIATTWLLWIPLPAGAPWAVNAIPAIGLPIALASLYATRLVRSRTPGNPPMGLAIGAIGLLLLGCLCAQDWG